MCPKFIRDHGKIFQQTLLGLQYLKDGLSKIFIRMSAQTNIVRLPWEPGKSQIQSMSGR